jgi:hypothetical protein
MRSFLVSVALAVLPIAVAAANLTPSLVLASPSMYDGKSVAVSGTVSEFTTRSTDLGNFTKFSLCDTKCITVIDKTQQSRTNKTAVTVVGTFRASFKGPHKTWTNVLMIGF